jgi:peptidoglycan/LPS O-acetylase OafA/YrhL
VALGITNRLSTAFNWRWLQFLGAISCSHYLIHNPVTGATFRIGSRLMADSAGAQFLWCIISIMTCIIAATVIWFCVERPIILIARKIAISNDLALPQSDTHSQRV